MPFGSCRLPQNRVPCPNDGSLRPVSESLRISEHYRRLTDDELIVIAHDSSDLTDLAQHALASELSQRKLKVPARAVPPPQPEPTSEEGGEDIYAEDRQLVEIATVWSLPDGVKLQDLLGRSVYLGRGRYYSITNPPTQSHKTSRAGKT
jgi:hypothetical protein